MSARFTELIVWVARITSTAVVLIILILFVGDCLENGFSPLLHLTVKEALMMLFLFVFWAGLIIGWKFELSGGLTSIISVTVFYLIDYLFSGSFPRGPYFFVFSIPALVYIYAGMRKRTR